MVRNPQFDREQSLAPGEELVFGRASRDAGQLDDSTLVSRRHGVIRATDDGFDVTSIGTYSGFVVRDLTTPSRLHIPCGFGPLAIPFARAEITFDHRVHGSLEVDVEGSEGAHRWHDRWGSEQEHDDEYRKWFYGRRGRGVSTQDPVGRALKANREPYTWFWTLVAMCEPEMTGSVGGVPTNSQLADRMVFTDVKTVERHLQDIYAALEIPDDQPGRRRDIAVRAAMDRGLVRREHLNELSQRYGR